MALLITDMLGGGGAITPEVLQQLQQSSSASATRITTPNNATRTSTSTSVPAASSNVAVSGSNSQIRPYDSPLNRLPPSTYPALNTRVLSLGRSATGGALPPAGTSGIVPGFSASAMGASTQAGARVNADRVRSSSRITTARSTRGPARPTPRALPARYNLRCADEAGDIAIMLIGYPAQVCLPLFLVPLLPSKSLA